MSQRVMAPPAYQTRSSHAVAGCLPRVMSRPAPSRRAVRLLVVATLIAGLLGLAVSRPGAAAAHPLGNFTINRYARVEPGARSVRVVYAIDMAEIPTFQEMDQVDRDGNKTISDAEQASYLERKLPELAGNLRLTVNGASVALRPEPGAGVTLGEGQGGLPLLRIDATFIGDLPAGAEGVLDASFRDLNYDNRVGWKEIVVRGTEGADVRDSTVTAAETSDVLRSYPQDALQSPIEVREARFRFEPGVAGAATGDTAARVAQRTKKASNPGILSRFAESAATKELTLPVVAVALVAAMFWGMVHALGPGHGKTVVAAYLVGSRGTGRHALLLGLTVTATHTASTYLIALVTLAASTFIVPERLYPILSVASGLMVIAMGLSLLGGRLRSSGVWPFRRSGADARQATHEHEHEHEHEHDHEDHGHDHGHEDHGHSHAVPGFDGTPVTWRSLMALGVYGGMIPCPTAIVVLLISISLNRLWFGLSLVVAFSVGLAVVLVAIGVMLVYAGRRMSRLSTLKPAARLAGALPLASACAVIVAGLLILLRAAGQSGLPNV